MTEQEAREWEVIGEEATPEPRIYLPPRTVVECPRCYFASPVTRFVNGNTLRCPNCKMEV